MDELGWVGGINLKEDSTRDVAYFRLAGKYPGLMMGGLGKPLF